MCQLQRSSADLKAILSGLICANMAQAWTVAIHHLVEVEGVEKVGVEEGLAICKKVQVCSVATLPSKV